MLESSSAVGKKASCLVLFALLLVLAGCGAGASATPGGSSTGVTAGANAKLIVVTTTTQIGSMVEAVAGDRATVRAILRPGADPHTFEPKPSDVQAISQSNVVFKNGLGLDTWVDKIIANAGGNRPLVLASAGVPVRKGGPQEAAGDPHIWFDPTNAMTMTRNIRDALVQVNPPGAPLYKANAEAYIARLNDLDKYIKDQIATVPPDRRKMVTNHDVFGYYFARYGLTYVGSIIPSMSSDAQPSAQDIAELIRKVKAENVKTIFLESSINPKLAQQIGGEAGVKVVDTLYGDTLGEVGTPGATYESMMRYDTDTIVKGLK